MSFEGVDLYPTLAEKAAALGFSLIKNHGFQDGNKRIGYEAMNVFLRLNHHDLVGSIDETERVILTMADGNMERGEFTEWLRAHVEAR